MRPGLLALGVTLASLAGCATTALKESTEFWVWRQTGEHRIADVLAADVTLAPWGGPWTVRARARTESGELVDYYESTSGEPMLEVSRRGFGVSSEFRRRGDAPCVVLEGEPDLALPIDVPVRHVDAAGTVEAQAKPLTLADASKATVVVFLKASGKLWVSTPPPAGRPIATDDQGRAFVSLEKDGGRTFAFRQPVDYGYRRSEEATAWFYAHLPLTLALDACLAPFSLAGVVLHAKGLDDGQTPIFGPDRDPQASPLRLPGKERGFEKPWEPPGPPITLCDPQAER